MAEPILLVSHYFPPHIGGIERVVRGQARHLALLGDRVAVLTTAVGALSGTEAHSDGYTIVRVNTWNDVERKTKIPFLGVAPWSIGSISRLVRSADVVHTHDVLYMTSSLAWAFSAIVRRALVVTQQLGIIDHLRRLVIAAQRLVYLTVGRGILRGSCRVLYVNSRVPHLLVNLGAATGKLASLPNGVDTDEFDPVDVGSKQRLRTELGLPPSEVPALFVGRFVPKKGYDVLLDAAGSEYRLVFIGADPAGSDNALNGSVFLGRLTSRELADVYRACDIFALPSAAEGFPLALHEAMASGLAAVTSDDPSYDVYNLDPQRISLVRRDVNGIREALVRIASDVEVRHRDGARFLRVRHLSHIVDDSRTCPGERYRDVLPVSAGA